MQRTAPIFYRVFYRLHPIHLHPKVSWQRRTSAGREPLPGPSPACGAGEGAPPAGTPKRPTVVSMGLQLASIAKNLPARSLCLPLAPPSSATRPGLIFSDSLGALQAWLPEMA